MAYIGNSPGVSSQRIVTTVTATAGQTTFTPTSGYTVGYIDVYLNGIKLVNGTDYTASNGSTVVFTDSVAVDDIVELMAYIPRGLSDGYTKTEADARYEPLDSAYTKSESDARYEPINTAYTKSEADLRFEPIDSAYTKAEADARYEPIDTAYTKSEADARYEPINTAYTKAEADARYEPIDTAYTKSESDARYMDINAVTLPDQSGHNGQFLQTNGTTADWAAVTQTQSDVHAFYINSSGELIWVHGSDVTELQDDNQEDIYDLVIFGNDDQTFSLNADGYLIVTN